MTDMSDKDGAGRIVVGVDGSEASKDALLWAAHEAELTGATLEVVMAREMPFRSYGRMVRVPDVDYAAEAGCQLRHIVHEVLGHAHGEAPLPRPANVTTTVLEGRPASALVDEAKGAEMLVIGSTGHNALAGMIRGSVSEQCIGRSTCPVVIVRFAKKAS